MAADMVDLWVNNAITRVKGLSRFGVSNVEVDTRIPEFKFKFYFPEIQIKANYSVTGKIMLMPLQGEGIVKANFSDVDATVTLTGTLVQKDRVPHIEITKIHPEYSIGGSKVHLENLFNGDEKLGSAMNAFLNENWKSVSEEIRP
uniref:Lipid-binding serum glycoprotein N-terminal domain-containing protein n=1 Tax=Megaselia scalaris TaxID=36166 RepID=T1GDW7_MEGSC